MDYKKQQRYLILNEMSQVGSGIQELSVDLQSLASEKECLNFKLETFIVCGIKTIDHIAVRNAFSSKVF